jgi:Peptidase A4 family/Fungal fucose-specific lectin
VERVDVGEQRMQFVIRAAGGRPVALSLEIACRPRNSKLTLLINWIYNLHDGTVRSRCKATNRRSEHDRPRSNSLIKRRTKMASKSQQYDSPSRFVLDDTAFRKKIPFALIPTNLKGAYTCPAPPHDFDPNQASASQLIQHGILWPRPGVGDDPALVNAWNEVFLRKSFAQDWIVPVLSAQVGKTHNLKHPISGATDQNFAQNAWSGAGLTTGKWTSVVGQWVVPQVSQPPEPQGAEGGWNSSSWAGIDGGVAGLSNDVLQAGILQTVDGNGQPGYVAFYEWYVNPQPSSPAYVYQTNISNFAVNAGDKIVCYVQYMDANTAGYLLLHNSTTHQTFAITLAPPPGASFNGSTAEWIMEAPDTGEPNSSIPRFTTVVFSVASANGPGGAGNLSNALTYSIKSASGKILTSTTIKNSTVTIRDIPNFYAKLSSGLACLYPSSKDGSRLYYLDSKNHINELAWAGSGWVNADTGYTAKAGNRLACLYAPGFGSRIYYLDSNNLVNELAWTGSAWQNTNTGALANERSSLTCLYASGYGSRVYYQGTDNHIYEVAWNGSSWGAPTNTQAKALGGSALTCLDAPGFGSRVYYVDENKNVNEVAWNGSGWGLPTNTLAQAIGGNALTCLYAPGFGSRVYYLGKNNDVNVIDVYEVAWNGSGWGAPTDTGGAANSESALTCLYAPGFGSRVYYQGTDNHIYEAAWNGSGWSGTDTERIANSGSALACLYAPDFGSRVYYIDSKATLHDLSWNGSAWATTL